ncbi:unnamed protein product, partial [Allacma fusca]
MGDSIFYCNHNIIPVLAFGKNEEREDYLADYFFLSVSQDDFQKNSDDFWSTRYK